MCFTSSTLVVKLHALRDFSSPLGNSAMVQALRQFQVHLAAAREHYINETHVAVIQFPAESLDAS
jgi:hypothetical protein